MKLFCILLTIFLCNGVFAQDCVFDRDTSFSTYPPLIMDESSWRSILPILETGDVRNIRISDGSTVVLACPETFIMATGTVVEEGTCSGGELTVAGTVYTTMEELGCDERLAETISKNVGTCLGGEEHLIGYDITGYEFYELIRICFDPVYETILSEYHVLRGESVSGSDGNPSRPSFKSDTGFFSVSANTAYEQATQEQLMEDILGDSGVIDTSQSLYFARGHMAPDADFLTEMEADATYYYINAVPQWQSFNNGNWRAMEEDIRTLAESHGTDLEIYTGPLNVLQLDDTNSNPVDIYLGLYDNEQVIPAPDITWKVVYEPSSNEGVAFVGVNNPYITSTPSLICEDICSSITWIDLDNSEYDRGYSYCCTVQDLEAAVPNAPSLGSAGILTQ